MFTIQFKVKLVYKCNSLLYIIMYNNIFQRSKGKGQEVKGVNKNGWSFGARGLSYQEEKGESYTTKVQVKKKAEKRGKQGG